MPAAIDIDTVKPTDYPVYFIDSNIWLAYFQNNRSEIIPDKEIAKKIEPKRVYIDYLIWLNDFLEANLKGINENDKSINHHRPKILFSSLLSSEVVNAYLRNICLKLYRIDKNDMTIVFKDYRKSLRYKKDVGMLVDDIVALKDYCYTTNDDFKEMDFFNTISDFVKDNDFNDYFYIKTCIKHECPIITHDGDFKNQSVTVLTKNKSYFNNKF
jgi:hypothetical protein